MHAYIDTKIYEYIFLSHLKKLNKCLTNIKITPKRYAIEINKTHKLNAFHGVN